MERDVVKVVAYCRVSTNKEEQENSLQNQRSYFENKAKSNSNFELINVYADEGLTGTKLNNRIKFNQMLYDAGIDIKEVQTGKDKRTSKRHIIYEISDRPPLFDEIWVKNTSRFARNTLSFEIISKLREKKVNIFFVEQNINTKESKDDFFLKLFQIFDEQDSKDKSSKVSFGIAEGARKGKISASGKLYGYKYIQSENRLEIIPEEAKVIEKIFMMYADGFGIRRIINELEANNIKTREGKTFAKSTISKILDNEKYAGLNVRLKYTTGRVLVNKHRPKLTDKSQWLISKNTDKIPPIIEEWLFDACKEIRNDKVHTTMQKGIYKGVSEYASLIVCGGCGNIYYSNSDKGRKFYNCSLKKSKGTVACNNPNVSLATLENKIENERLTGYRDEIIRCKDICSLLLSFMQSDLKGRLDLDKTEEIKALKILLTKAETQLSKLVDLLIDDKITQEIYDPKYFLISSQIEDMKVKIYELSKDNDKIMQEIKDIEQAMSEIDNIEIMEHYAKDDILQEISKISVLTTGEIVIHYKIVDKIDTIINKNKIYIDENSYGDLENWLKKTS